MLLTNKESIQHRPRSLLLSLRRDNETKLSTHLMHSVVCLDSYPCLLPCPAPLPHIVIPGVAFEETPSIEGKPSEFREPHFDDTQVIHLMPSLLAAIQEMIYNFMAKICIECRLLSIFVPKMFDPSLMVMVSGP